MKLYMEFLLQYVHVMYQIKNRLITATQQHYLIYRFILAHIIRKVKIFRIANIFANFL